MTTLQTIYVETEFDIMFARRMIRDIARSMGFAPSDQARVSLATSSLAHFLDLGGQHPGAISFHTYQGNGTPPRMQIVCTRNSGQASSTPSTKDPLPPSHTTNPNYPNAAFEKVKRMVDDLQIEASASQDLQITLTKYITSDA